MADTVRGAYRSTRIYISYAQSDQPWAEWISQTLRESGYRTKIAAIEDYYPINDKFLPAIVDEVTSGAQMVAVLSSAYLESTIWAWRSIYGVWYRESEKRRLVLMRVDDIQTDLLWWPAVESVDVFGIERDIAKARMLGVVSGEPVSESTSTRPTDIEKPIIVC